MVLIFPLVGLITFIVFAREAESVADYVALAIVLSVPVGIAVTLLRA